MVACHAVNDRRPKVVFIILHSVSLIMPYEIRLEIEVTPSEPEALLLFETALVLQIGFKKLC